MSQISRQFKLAYLRALYVVAWLWNYWCRVRLVLRIHKVRKWRARVDELERVDRIRNPWKYLGRYTRAEMPWEASTPCAR